jgi:twitching motility protein PilJ
MSFLNKIKGWGQKDDAAAPGDAAAASPAFDELHVTGAMYAAPNAAGDHHTHDTTSAAVYDVPTVQQSGGLDTSIITEAAPSEMAEFSETRLQDGGRAAAAAGTGLPLIGTRPVADQQRILIAMALIGLIGLIVVTFMSLLAANRGSAQVAASGQALMQSQRLAKSVSQALIGSPAAFPEVKESADVLVKNVRSLRTGEGSVSAAPSSVQDAIEPMLPLVDRAEKNAATVLGQQKILTEVGKALRAINRQSSDLLETAETVSSLKLQQEASPAELSAVGQLVMLTQRIGKSANEFLTMEGVSPEAVFLLGKDLNSVR